MGQRASSLVTALLLCLSLFSLFCIRPTFSQDEHDIAVTRVVSDFKVAWYGYPVHIYTIVTNLGTYDETFNLTIYANSTILKEIDNIYLASGANTTIVISWDYITVKTMNINWITPPFIPMKYILSASATPVENETNTSNNTCTGNMVTIAQYGDLNGDGKLGVLDLIFVAIKLGSTQYPDFNLMPYPIRADWNGDCKVNVLDLIIEANAISSLFGPHPA
jgi:hypothetical protein